MLYTYNAVGVYSVTEIVNGLGGSSTNTQANYITVTCGYTLSTTNASFGDLGGSGTVTVSALNTCSWTANSNDSWIQITGGSINATGNAAVAYTVLSNGGTTSARVGTMTIAGQTFTVAQSGDTAAPVVILTAPTSGVVSGTVTVGATATDDIGVASVEFYRDANVLLGVVTTPPYSVNFNTTSVADGPHCLVCEGVRPGRQCKCYFQQLRNGGQSCSIDGDRTHRHHHCDQPG